MAKCNKTGLTDRDWKTVLDVLNMFDPNDVAHVVPGMATPEFMQDVDSAFKAVLGHVQRQNIRPGPYDKKPKAVDHEIVDQLHPWGI